MIYDITHVTEFDYEERVSVSHHVARLTPRRSGRQTPLAHTWTFDPAPAVLREHQDVFGNPVAFFAMQGPHRRLSVTSRAAVDVAAPPPLPARSPAWETVRDGVDALPIEVFDFVVDSPLVAAGPAYAAYAAASFPPGRAIVDGLVDLTHRLHEDLEFAPGATTIATPIAEVFRQRSGVCQDFAHLQIACLRSLGLPARYVSGYLETSPPPDEPRLVGVDASHAWIALYVPERRLDRRRPDQRSRPRRPPRDAGVGPRLRRRQPDPRRHPRRRGTADARGRGHRPPRLAVALRWERRSVAAPQPACGRRRAPSAANSRPHAEGLPAAVPADRRQSSNGPRLRRRQPDPRRHSRRWRTADARGRGHRPPR